ncbi:MAG: hypothetical protein P9M03_09640 [Candidatus Theseobacter exili]|nr:hypothetical protein [Candidatus Theseobacter exili]
MIKLNGSVSRKVPIPGQEFSSQSFSAGMEAEVGNDASQDEIRAKIKEMYSILESSVKEQISSNGVHLPEEKEPISAHAEQRSNGGNGDITPNQKRLLEKLVKEQEIFGKERIALLAIKSKSEATEVIKDLIERNKNGGGGKNGK